VKAVFKRFLRWCPGAIGILLRQKIYPRYFNSCGRGVLFGRFIDLKHPNKINLGNHVVINSRSLLDCSQSNDLESFLTLEDGVFIGEATDIRCRGKSLIIRSGANVSSGCSLITTGTLTVGKKTLIASYCRIGNDLTKELGNRDHSGSSTTVIGDNCWLGVRAEIAEGCTVGEGVIVGAHSEVRSDLPERTVCFGRPTIVIKRRETRVKKDE